MTGDPPHALAHQAMVPLDHLRSVEEARVLGPRETDEHP